VEALSALKRLQELLQEGAEPFAKRVMLEILNPDIVGREATHDDAHASTPLLREIQEGAELIRVEVTKIFSPFDVAISYVFHESSSRSLLLAWQLQAWTLLLVWGAGRSTYDASGVSEGHQKGGVKHNEQDSRRYRNIEIEYVEIRRGEESLTNTCNIA